MSFSWERRLAENITNADHMRDVRKRIDMEHEVAYIDKVILSYLKLFFSIHFKVLLVI